MPIQIAIERVPGRRLLIPLMLCAGAHPSAPHAGPYSGSFTNGRMGSTVSILAVWFFCMEANPQIIGSRIPEFQPIADSANAITATACLLAAMVVPILTVMWARRYLILRNK